MKNTPGCLKRPTYPQIHPYIYRYIKPMLAYIYFLKEFDVFFTNKSEEKSYVKSDADSYLLL